jgi:UMP-CMP kinase
MESLWEEYQNRRSVVSEIVHQVDKLEALQQAQIYALRYPDLDLNDFKGHRKEITDAWLAQKADETIRKWDAAEVQRSAITVIFVVGGPGVGKGTQCALAAKDLNFEHISVGDLLRREQNSPRSFFQDFISSSIRHSVVVPPLLTMMLITTELDNARAQGRTGIFLDGFPRSLEQLKAFEEQVGCAIHNSDRTNRLQVSKQYSTIFMDCPDAVLIERLSYRAGSSGREDDNPDSIRRRVEAFEESKNDILEALSKNKLQTVCCAPESSTLLTVDRSGAPAPLMTSLSLSKTQ